MYPFIILYCWLCCSHSTAIIKKCSLSLYFITGSVALTPLLLLRNVSFYYTLYLLCGSHFTSIIKKCILLLYFIAGSVALTPLLLLRNVAFHYTLLLALWLSLHCYY